MSTVAEGLRQDHEDMRTMVAVLVELANRVDDGQVVPPEDLERILGYLDTFVNRCHHAKEETLLFPALEEAGIEHDGGPLEIMTAEHQLENNFLSSMTDAASRYAGGEQQAAHLIAQYARDYASLLSRDMEQEDQIIYPLAEQRLPAPRQDELAGQFAQIEQDVLGPDRHEDYHHVAKQLAERYLN
jgi:hemerythrin-like domain-containing protein